MLLEDAVSSRCLTLVIGALFASACSTEGSVGGGSNAPVGSGAGGAAQTGPTASSGAGPATGGGGNTGGRAGAGSSASSGSGATATGGGASGASGTGVGAGSGGGSGMGAAGSAPRDAGSVDSGLGPPSFQPGELDAPSNGGTITFQNVGKAGSFPSRRDPATGPCDFSSTADCCKTRFTIASDKLTPWDEDLIMSLRGPLLVKQIVAYQPMSGNAQPWQRTSVWDNRTPLSSTHIAFDGNNAQAGFNGVIGSECLVDVSTSDVFPCGSGSVPYCPPANPPKHYGWQGSKMFVLLSVMPFANSGKVAGACSQGTTGGWYNAPWVGLSVGELVRSGKFGTCHCYSTTTAAAGDGCGQFNVFETVNDNNSFQNFDVYSTNFFGYAGYVGEGPCGMNCRAALFPPAADLIDKATSLEARQGVVSGPGLPVGAAFRRGENGYRYYIILMDVDTRTVQLAIVHPQKIPAAFGGFLPDFPALLPRSAVDAALAARLPR